MENMLEVKLKGKALMFGLMVKLMKVNGFMEESMVMELGSKKTAGICMFGNGGTERLVAMEFTLVFLVRSMKVHGSIHVRMEKELNHFQTVMFTLEIIREVIPKA